MMETVTEEDTNKNFSQILRRVRAGESLVITSDGTPVAKLIPFSADNERAEAARARVIARLRELTPANLGTFTRDQAYEDGEQ
jgi:prevent-host-death family protein